MKFTWKAFFLYLLPTSDITSKYFDKGNELFKRAKKLKQPEKGENAAIAYYCYSVANSFIKDEKTKQAAFDRMIDCQRLQRAAKK